MSDRNLWIAQVPPGEPEYVLVPLDGFITRDSYKYRITRGFTVYRAAVTDADLSEILLQFEGVWDGMFKYLEEAGKLVEMREEDVPY